MLDLLAWTYVFAVATAYPAVLDWIDRLEQFKSAREAWLSFLTFTGNYGFSFGALADLPGSHWRAPDSVLSLTWPKAWQDRYVAKNYMKRDPSVRALTRTREPYTWAEGLAFGNYTRADRNIVFEAREYGLHNGLVVPIIGIRTGAAVVTLAGDNNRLTSRERAELHFAAIYVQARVRALSPDKHRVLKIPVLTARERECLEWAAAGKSDWEIGEILTISARTAGAHIERAKQKLGVATRIQAVVIAIQNGAISI